MLTIEQRDWERKMTIFCFIPYFLIFEDKNGNIFGTENIIKYGTYSYKIVTKQNLVIILMNVGTKIITISKAIARLRKSIPFMFFSEINISEVLNFQIMQIVSDSHMYTISTWNH